MMQKYCQGPLLTRLGSLSVFVGVCLLTTLTTSDTAALPAAQPAGQPTTASEPGPASAETDHANIMGVSRADCKKCHASEVATWMKTVHFLSPEQRLYKYEGNAKKYADALGIGQEELLSTSVCSDCHGTVAMVEGQRKVVSGVSCESCHGPAGGEDGWLNRHQSYHESMKIPREQETEDHKAERHKACDAAGMIRSTNIYGLAKNCYGCHLIGNEELVAAGHKASSTFDLVSWSSGEVRHNFFMNKQVNAEAPSLWMESEQGKAADRKRIKFIVGTLVQLETALRLRANATNPAVIPQYGGIAAAANGKIAQINAVAGTPETIAAGALTAPMLATLFVPMPTDRETYTAVADRIAGHTRAFLEAHDGSQLSAIDAMIQLTPPHFSQQYKQKYGN